MINMPKNNKIANPEPLTVTNIPDITKNEYKCSKCKATVKGKDVPGHYKKHPGIEFIYKKITADKITTSSKSL